MATAFTAIQTAWQTLASFFGPAIDRVKESFTGLSTQVEPVKTAVSGLLTAFQNLWTAVQPIVVALGTTIGAVLGIVALFALNAFSAAIDALGPVVTTVVDQIKLTINTVADIIREATALIKAVIDGDWQAAWTSAQTIGESIVTFLQETWENFATLMETILTAIYDTVINTLTDLGVDAEATVDAIKTWWQTKWEAMKGFVQPVIDIIDTLKEAIESFSTWIGSISIPNPFSGILDSINGIRDKLPGWVPGSSQAVGTSWAPGGLTEVGERGREFIIQPPGARTLTNGQSNRLAAQGAEMGGGMTVTMGPVYMSDKMDVEAIAYRVATIIERRRR
jgi:phage-related protein